MKTRSKLLVLAGGSLAAAVVLVLAIPSPIDPAAWNPPAAPALEGVLAPGSPR
jgi:hypothetical protein